MSLYIYVIFHKSPQCTKAMELWHSQIRVYARPCFFLNKKSPHRHCECCQAVGSGEEDDYKGNLYPAILIFTQNINSSNFVGEYSFFILAGYSTFSLLCWSVHHWLSLSSHIPVETLGIILSPFTAVISEAFFWTMRIHFVP